MKNLQTKLTSALFVLAASLALSGWAQAPDNRPPRDGEPDLGGPPPFGPDGPGGRGGGPGGFGGPMTQKTKLVKQFDKDGDGRLNASERKAAREFLQKERTQGRGRRGFGGPRGGFGGRGGEQTPPQPGEKLSPADVKSFPDAPLYDAQTLRTFFLEFEDADWEKEMADFKDTDVDVPAKLTVDGKVYPDVGVHFRGMSSFMMVGEGRKRSLNISLDFVHKEQNIGGYRTLNLMNSHEDPTFLRTVLSYQIERDYVPAPKANFARVVINGESWGVYVNVQQFNKDFTKEWFNSTKGARWKVRGSPNGRGSLAYLGDDAEPYKQIYTIKTKDTEKSWKDLIKLCKTLNETPAEKLEAALAPMLDIDGALKFLALDNALINNDGYWIRTSDYSVYEEENGRFHILPQDSNETFVKPGGPGFGGGGMRGGGPGMMLAPQIFSQADRDTNQKVTKAEFTALADAWFDKLDPDKTGKLSQEQFVEKFGDVLPPPQGFGPPGGGRGGFGPGRFMGSGFFTSADVDKDGSLTRAELKETFAKWFADWDSDKSGSLNEEKFRTGLIGALPRPNFGGRGGGPGGPGGGGRGFGGSTQINGVDLDPLIAANDENKPLISKLLAVPSLRAKYLGYVRDIAEKWLDWSKLGPLSEQYQAVIASDISKDTRKLDATESFAKGLTENVVADGPGGETIGLKIFAEQRRKYLLNYVSTNKPPVEAR